MSMHIVGLLIAFLVGGGIGAPSAEAAPADTTYWAYVGAESADLIHRIRFDGAEAVVEKTTPVGELFIETEGPHGLAVSPDGEYLYMSTGHGVPDGKFWKYHLGPDTLVAGPIDLGRFPATVDVTPDGEYAFIVNFNLHGARVPSSVSVVHTDEFVEVARPEVGVMPHGSRVSPDGRFQYTGVMMDDHVVEIDTRTFDVARRFNVAVGEEGPLEPELAAHHDDAGSMSMAASDGSAEATCSPTWAQPSATGEHVYVACNANDTVLEISTADWALSRVFETGTGPYNLDVTADNRLLIVTLKQGDGVEFIDLERGETVAQTQSSTTITHGVATSPDSRYAFISVEGIGAEPGRVDVYDLQRFDQVATVEVGQQASGIVFWKMEPAP